MKKGKQQALTVTDDVRSWTTPFIVIIACCCKREREVEKQSREGSEEGRREGRDGSSWTAGDTG
jgi:hypothetical protein